MRTAKRRTSSYVVKLEPEQLAQLQLQLAAGPPRPPRPPAPTFSQAFERFLTWSRANKQRPSTLYTKRCLWRCHLEARFGTKPIDALRVADVEQLKADVGKLSAKRVNTLLSILRKMLKLAVKRGELEQLPQIEAVPETQPDFEYYDFAEYAQLVAGAGKTGLRELAVVLLGGDAGLRMGEQLGLQRGDVDLVRKQLHVRRSDSEGELVAPKGGRSRVVPMTQLLVDVLRVLFTRSPSSRSDARVLVTLAGGWQVKPADVGEPLSVQRIRTLMERAQRAAGLEVTGNLHGLRHTFCSHLAMRGAPTVAIKKLAGHVSISTTERYMHLADPERQRAIGLLDQARVKVSAETAERSQRSEPIGLSEPPHSNAGDRATRGTQQEASGTPESAALTPRRFELLRVERASQVEWLEHLLGSLS